MKPELCTLEIAVVQRFEDGDVVSETYEMPVSIDPVNAEQASEIVAWHINQMALVLKGLDRRVHRMQ